MEKDTEKSLTAKAATAKSVERRKFLQTITVATGAAGLAPQLYAVAEPAIAAPVDGEATANPQGQTKQLAQYAVRLRYEEIPADVLQRTKDCIADTVGVILFGAQFPWSQMIIAQARRMGAGKCAILSTGASVPAPAAALAHGAMTHAFEQDNLTFPDSGAHPGAALVTSGLAVSQEHGSSGRELLTAFVAGAEVMIRTGRATKRTNEARGFHAPGTLGPFGAAIVSGKLMNFDEQKMTNALGIAASTSGWSFGIFSQRRWRHGEATASGARRGKRSSSGKSRRRRLYRSEHRDRRPAPDFSKHSATRVIRRN